MKVTVHSEDFFYFAALFHLCFHSHSRRPSSSLLWRGFYPFLSWCDTLLLASLVPVYLGETADCSESSSRMHVDWSGLVQRAVSSEENGQYVLRWKISNIREVQSNANRRISQEMYRMEEWKMGRKRKLKKKVVYSRDIKRTRPLHINDFINGSY